MKLYKKILFKLFKILPITAIVVIIAGCIVLAFVKQKPEELSEKDFIDKAFTNHISGFTTYNGTTYMMELPSGEEFTHDFKDEAQVNVFNDLIIEKFGTIDTSTSLGYEREYKAGYLILIGGTLCVGVLILLFYVTVVLWFVSLFDLLKSEFTENHNKWIWLICLILLPFIAQVFYAFIAVNQKRPINTAVV